MTQREVTEFDLKPEQFEFRADGKIVRKDRWERAVREIAAAYELGREWEIEGVVEAATKAAGRCVLPEGWSLTVGDRSEPGSPRQFFAMLSCPDGDIELCPHKQALGVMLQRLDAAFEAEAGVSPG